MFTGEKWKPIDFQRKRRAGCNMKRYDIYVNVDKLENYGFIKAGKDYKLPSPNRRTTMILAWVNGTTHRVSIYSASSHTIKVLCEMYKDGNVYFEDYTPNTKQSMQLTPEECEMIQKLRREKHGKGI